MLFHGKGKGKATDASGSMKLPKEDVDTMPLDQVKAEIAEVEELQADLNLKVGGLILKVKMISNEGWRPG